MPYTNQYIMLRCVVLSYTTLSLCSLEYLLEGIKHLSQLQALRHFVVKRSLVDCFRELNTDGLLLFTCKLDHYRSVQSICWAADWLHW